MRSLCLLKKCPDAQNPSNNYFKINFLIRLSYFSLLKAIILLTNYIAQSLYFGVHVLSEILSRSPVLCNSVVIFNEGVRLPETQTLPFFYFHETRGCIGHAHLYLNLQDLSMNDDKNWGRKNLSYGFCHTYTNL